MILTEVQWHEAKRLISDAIEFGEAVIGNDDSETLTSLKEREEKLTSI